MDLEKAYNSFLTRLARRVKLRREELSMTQKELAHKFGFNERYIQKIESGTYSPNLFTMFKLAKALKISISSLLDTENHQEPD
jgi:DNA-binding XRE family transcriptional regulator